MTEPVSVLVVGGDDRERTARSLSRQSDRLEVETATGPSAVPERLAAGGIDCVVAGHESDGMDGVALLEAVRDDHPDLPFVLFTDAGSEAVASEAISAGVSDYVPRDGDDDRFAVLANSVLNAVEQYRAERALRRRERELGRQNDRLRALFESFPEPTLAYVHRDGEPEVVDVNEAFTEVFGFERSEAVGEHVDDLVVPPDREAEAKEIDERVRRGEAVDEVLERRTVDERRTFRFRNVRLPEDDEIDGYAIYADVTDRVRRERELERQNERLDEFARVVSHDLRNPLKVAEGRLSLAEEDCDSEHLDDVARAHDRMEALIEDLLTFAREGDPVDDVESVDLAALVESCWAHVGATEAALRVETDQTVRADRSRLRRMLENLLRNAVDHGATGDQPVTVTVGALEREPGFFVADDGPGIPEPEREKVLESGYSTAGEGTGLGLAIVEGIASAHDWEVAVTDSEAGGARFEFRGVTQSE